MGFVRAGAAEVAQDEVLQRSEGARELLATWLPDGLGPQALVRQDLRGLFVLVEGLVTLARVELQEEVRLDGADLCLAGSEEELLLTARLALVLDHLLGADLHLPALHLEEGDDLGTGVHGVSGLPRVPSAEDVALFDLAVAPATPGGLEPLAELAVDAPPLPAVHLDLARAAEDHEEVGRVPQRVFVAPEDELLLEVLRLLAVAAAVATDEAPARELHHAVADLRGQEPEVAVLATAAEDVLAGLVVAVAEGLVAAQGLCAEALQEEGVQCFHGLCVLLLQVAADLNEARGAQLHHEVGRHEVHGVRGLEDHLGLPDIPQLAHVAAVHHGQRPAELARDKVDEPHRHEAHVV
mmetsp:Transcript_293/g.878  ORF Transcript_293/g.878 Transcript_293/m.878 type:complete len:353 (+) Transcript_293:1388-2446(+)